MSVEQNKAEMRRFAEEAINRKNWDAIHDLVAEDFVDHVPFPGQGPGRDGLRDVIGVFTRAFPDIQWTTHEQIGEGDTVVSRFTWTGTHRGEFLGIPATGRRVNVWGVVIDVVRDGKPSRRDMRSKFTESRILMDTLSLMQQLGVLG